MAVEIVMPRLGWTMEEGTLVEWLKEDGEMVEAGEILLTVESDKAINEVESFEAGVLRIPPDSPSPGTMVSVGTLLAYIVQPGEPVPFEGAGSRGAGEQESKGAGERGGWGEKEREELLPGSPAPRLPGSPARRARTISPRAARLAAELGVDWTGIEGSGRSGRIVERDVRAAAVQRMPATEVSATPVTRRMAEEAGIDLAQLAAQKPGGRIQREDVEAAIAAREAGVGSPAGEVISTTQIRRLIAQRMSESAHTTAPVTLTTEADATELVALREQFKATFTARGIGVPTINDLVVKLTAVALQEHPKLNAYWQEGGIVILKSIHVGIAVDTDDGLLVPVIRDVQIKGLRQIAEESRALVEKAQSRQLSPDDLQGGTFTITNLGMYGIDAFTPIINLPQCAILGVGRIVKRPAVHNDQVVPRQMMALSLTFDHRVVDGGPAARFLNTVREFIEQPSLWLMA